MAKAFDPIAEGASLAEGFDPMAEGASLVEEPVDNRNLLQKAGGFAQRNINEPIQDIMRQANEMSSGAFQGMANIGPGIYNIGAKASNILPNFLGMEGERTKEMKGFHFAPKTANAFAGELGSYFGPGLLGKIPEIAAIPKHIESIPMIANAIKKAGDLFGKTPKSLQKSINALSKPVGSISKGAAQGAVYNPEDQGLGALLGGGGAALGKGLGYAVPKITNKLGITGQPGENVASYVDPEKYKEKFEASQRLGRTLTPGELTENPWIAGKEAAFKRTEKGSFENVEQGKNKISQETNAIKDFLDKIYDKSTKSDEKINELYKSVEKWNLKPNIMNKLKEDPLIERSINKVSKSPAWQRNLKDVPENNIAYLDKVKRDLGAKEQKLKKSEGGSGEAREYELARKDLTKVMDKAVPGYKEARKEAEKRIIRNNIEKKLKKSEISGTEFYKKIIENDIEFNKLHKKLRNVPEAQDKLMDMKKSFKTLINLKSAPMEAAQKENFWNSARSSVMQLYQSSKDFLGLSDSKEAIKYLNNRKWFDDLVAAKSKKEKNDILDDIMSKMLPAGLNIAEEGKKE